MYNLKVTDNNGSVLIDEPYTVDGASCVSGGICSVTPTVELPFGLVNWWIAAANDTGKGPESKKGIFALAPVPKVPEAATLVAPKDVISNLSPTFRWNAVLISSWYRLYAKDGSGKSNVSQWYKAADANCQSGAGECFVTPNAIVAVNPVTWWVQTWNSAGYGNWSESKVFLCVSLALTPNLFILPPPLPDFVTL